jgi:RNA polymerase sigma-70 factor (ECF subfamily)
MNENKKFVRLIKEEDMASFEALFRLNYPRMKKYAFHFLQNEEEANDLIQDVFLQLWSKRDDLEEEKNITAFIFTLLKNKCLSVIRRRVLESKYIQQEMLFETERLYDLSFTQSKEFESMQSLLFSEIESMISTMPEKCGIAFKLKWIEGKKIKEIAQIMNISTTMVDKHLASGMKIAKKKIHPDLFLLFLFAAE